MNNFFELGELTIEAVNTTKEGTTLLVNNGEARGLALVTVSKLWKMVDEEGDFLKMQRGTKKPSTNSLRDGNIQITLDLVNKLASIYKTQVTIREQNGRAEEIRIRHNNVGYMLITVSAKGFTVGVKSKALIEESIEYRRVTHGFDARISFTTWDIEVYNTVQKIHNLAYLNEIKDKTK